MATREDLIRELQRRAESGEFNDSQQAAFAELQRRGVVPKADATGRLSQGLSDVLSRAGVPQADVERLQNTGLTPGTVPEFAAAHVQDLRGRGIDPSPDRQVAIQDMYRQQAGQEPRVAGRDFLQEARERKRQQKMQTVLGRAQNVGEIAGTALGEGVISGIGVVSGETAADLREDMNQTFNVNRESQLQNLAGGVVGEGLTAAGALATGPWGMAAIYGGRGAGTVRTDIAERRQAGEDISGGQELAAAAGTGGVEAASGFVGAKLFGGIGRALQQTGANLTTRGGIRAVVGQGAKVAGLSGVEGLEESATELAVNKIAQGTYDPERAITEGVYEAFVMGGVLAPILGGAANMPRFRRGGETVAGASTANPVEDTSLTAADTTDATPEPAVDRPAAQPPAVSPDRMLPDSVSLARQRLVEAEQQVEALTRPLSQPPSEGVFRVSPEGEARRGIPTDPPPQPGLDAQGNRLPPPDGMNEVQFRRWYKREFPDASLTDIVDQWNQYPGKATPTPTQEAFAERTAGGPGVLTPDAVVQHMVNVSPKETPDIAPGPEDFELAQAAQQEREAEAAYFSGVVQNLEHGDQDFVRVSVPLDKVSTLNQPDASTVDSYASQDTPAPPIVAGTLQGEATGSPTVIDGKHRVAAAQQRGEKTIRAYMPRADAEAMNLIRRPARLEGTQPDVGRIREARAEVQRRRAELQMAESQKAPSANREIQQIAEEYGNQRGVDVSHTPGPLNPLTARRLARAYSEAAHKPNDPRVQASYEAFNRETLDQFNDLQARGYVIEPWEGEGQPYANVAEMARDVADNKHLFYFKTDGTSTDLPADHPMRQEAPGTGGLLYNDVFRAVHDVYGHAKDGYGFDIEGEENAWRSHSQMYSDLARGAMTTETRGQSTWVGYGPQGRANRKAIEDGREEDITFAPQKATLLPEEWWTAPGLRPPQTDILPSDEKQRKSFLGTLRRGRKATEKATPIEGTTHKRHVPKTVEDIVTPLNSRIKDISHSIFNRLMRMEFDTGTARERLKKELHGPAARITKALGGKKTQQYRQFKQAVLNGDGDSARAMLSEDVRSDLDQFYSTFRGLLDNLREAGVTIGDLGESYWPRHIRDFKSFQEVFGDDTGIFEEAWELAKATKGRQVLTADEKAEIANAVLMGYGPRKPGSTGFANARQRTVENIPDDAVDFYLDPMEAAFRYIDGATYAAERTRFLGRNARDPEQIQESVGALVQEAVDEGNLTADQQAELHDLLTSRFTADLLQTSKFVRNFKQLVYMTTLGQFRSTLTQLTDVAIGAVTHGIRPTAQGMGAALGITNREKRLMMEDVGVHDHGEEFKDIGKIAAATDWTLRRTGFRRVDRFGKEVRLNAGFEALKSAVAKPNSKQFAEFRRDYESVLGEDEFQQVVDDFRLGRKTENTRYVLFLDLAKIQPVTLSQMPKKYLDMPNGRILWTLKTFTVMQLDFVRRDMIRKLRTQGQRREGLRNLARYAVFFGLADLGVDLLKDLLRGRQPTAEDVPDRAVDAMLAMVGLHRYTIEKAASSPSEAALDFVVPPLSWVDAPFTDLTSDAAGVRTIRQFPVVGELLYYWAPFGRGSHLTEEEAQRDYRSRLRDLRTEAEEAYLDGDMELVRKLLFIYNDRRKQGPGDGRQTDLGIRDLRRRVTSTED